MELLKKRTMNFFREIPVYFQFARVHRSYIVNTQLITRIDAYEKDNHQIQTSTGAALPVSRTGDPRLKEVLGI